MFEKKKEDTDVIESLKNKGLTCSKLKSLISKQQRDAKNARNDASTLRTVGLETEANRQEAIAKAEESSSNSLRNLRRKLCPLR